MATKLKEQYLKGFLSPEDFDAIAAQAVAAHQTLCKRTGRGNDFLGWLDLPAEYDRDEFCRIQMAAQKSGGTATCLSSSALAAPTWGRGR